MPEVNIRQLFSTLGIGIFSTVFLSYFLYLITDLLIPFFKELMVIIKYKWALRISIRNKTTHPDLNTFFSVKKDSINASSIKKSKFIRYISFLRNSDFSNYGIPIIVFITLFGFGVLMQEVSTQVTDPGIKILGLKAKNDIRLSPLIGEDSLLTSLGVKIFNSSHIKSINAKVMRTNYFPDSVNAKDFWKQNYRHLISDKDFNNYVKEIYYAAKNWCYLFTTNVKDEINDYHEKMEFAKSLFVLSYFFAPASLVLYLIYLLMSLMLRSMKVERRFYPKIAEIKQKRSVHFPMAVFILSVTMYMSYKVYMGTSTGFNGRVYGYYLDHFYYTDSLEIK